MTSNEYKRKLQTELINEFITKFTEKVGYPPIVIAANKDSDIVKYDVLSLFELEKCFENFLPVVKNKTLRLNTACRSREIKDLRHTFCFIARLMKYTHANIGKYLNRHHTTVINSVKTFRNLYQTDEVFKARYHNIINHIKNKHESPIMENLDKI